MRHAANPTENVCGRRQMTPLAAREAMRLVLFNQKLHQLKMALLLLPRRQGLLDDQFQVISILSSGTISTLR